MPDDDRNWFVTERSDALASLLLTSRPDVTVKSESRKEDGVDILATLNDAKDPASRVFVVQVKGTTSTDERVWMENVKQLYGGPTFYLPTCVFMINVRTNDATYAWVAEPQVEGKTAKLNFFEKPDFHVLDRAAIDEIVDRIRAWYDSIPRMPKAIAS